MIDRSIEWLALLEHFWNAAMAALNSISMTVTLIALTAILAAAGGMVSGKMLLYGAIVGGMLINAAVKAMGGGFAAALTAMIVTTALGFALGSTPLLLRLLKRQKTRS
jgi:hypothetical protein